MPDPVTAIVGSAVVGGAVSYASANKAASAQKSAADSAAESADAQLEFQKQQYEDWKSIYGETSDNLAEFYNNYDAEYVTALGLHNIEKEYNTSKQKLIRNLAQRGIDTSGLTAAALTQLEIGKASEKANVRASAPLVAAQAQQSFLGLGLRLESSLQSGISNAYQNQQQMYTNQAAAYGQQAAIAGQGFSNSIGSIGTGISTYMQMQAMQPQSAYNTSSYVEPINSPTPVNATTAGPDYYTINSLSSPIV